MNLLLEALAAAMFATGGALLGRWFSRLPKPYWTLGYFIPLALILIYRVALVYPALAFMPPASWMMIGLRKYAVLGFVTPMVLTTPLSRLPRRRERLLVGLLSRFSLRQIGRQRRLTPVADLCVRQAA